MADLLESATGAIGDIFNAGIKPWTQQTVADTVKRNPALAEYLPKPDYSPLLLIGGVALVIYLMRR